MLTAPAHWLALAAARAVWCRATFVHLAADDRQQEANGAVGEPNIHQEAGEPRSRAACAARTPPRRRRPPHSRCGPPGRSRVDHPPGNDRTTPSSSSAMLRRTSVDRRRARAVRHEVAIDRRQLAQEVHCPSTRPVSADSSLIRRTSSGCSSSRRRALSTAPGSFTGTWKPFSRSTTRSAWAPSAVTIGMSPCICASDKVMQ